MYKCIAKHNIMCTLINSGAVRTVACIIIHNYHLISYNYNYTGHCTICCFLSPVLEASLGSAAASGRNSPQLALVCSSSSASKPVLRHREVERPALGELAIQLRVPD